MTQLLLLALAAVTVVALRKVIGDRAPRWRRLPLALVLLALVAVPAVVELWDPGLLHNLLRDPAAIAGGQWWRMATAIFVQDHGLSGTVVNLLLVLLVAPGAGQVWGFRRGFGLFLGLGVALNVLASINDVPGGGSSGATLALAGATIAFAGLCSGSRGALLTALTGAVAAGSWWFGDAHGVAVALGLAVGCLAYGAAGLAGRRRARSASAVPQDRPPVTNGCH